MTQRKFLRHMTKSGSSEESEPYPRLMVIDFLTDKEKQDKMDELRKQTLGARKKTTFGAGKEGEGEADGKADEQAEVNYDDYFITLKVIKMKIVKFANRVYSGEMAHNEPPHLDLHCLLCYL